MALSMRRNGATYKQIAEALEISVPRAWTIVRNEIDKVLSDTQETARDVLQIELDRLDALWRAHFPIAIRHSKTIKEKVDDRWVTREIDVEPCRASAYLCLSIVNQRSRLLNLSKIGDALGSLPVSFVIGIGEPPKHIVPSDYEVIDSTPPEEKVQAIHKLLSEGLDIEADNTEQKSNGNGKTPVRRRAPVVGTIKQNGNGHNGHNGNGHNGNGNGHGKVRLWNDDAPEI